VRERGRSWAGVLPPERKNWLGVCIRGLYEREGQARGA
jgi:hypothetical protein